MTFQNPHATSSLSLWSRFHQRRFHQLGGRKLAVRLGSGLMALSLSLAAALPTLAADPFRAGTTTASHDIGPLTEEAFKAIFKDGNYKSAKDYLAQAETAEPGEPLVQAMLASMEYLSGNFENVNQRAAATKSAAQALKSSDPLRSHLYTAVGTFLEGAYVLKTQGVARGTPAALGMLQTVFNELDKAESIDPTDPELNLLKGYMDLMLAVNLPFSNPEEAITRMSDYGSPTYITQRGIAVGYRDLGDYDKAVAAVDKAIAAAPNNPELLYLKAQLLAKQGAKGDSAVLFKKALESADQLPTSLVKQITWEGCRAEGVATFEQCQSEREGAEGAF